MIYWKYFTRATAVRWSLVCPQNVFPCSFQYEFRKLTCINCKKAVVLLQIHNCRAKKNCFYILSRCSRKPFETSCIAAQRHAMLTFFFIASCDNYSNRKCNCGTLCFCNLLATLKRKQDKKCMFTQWFTQGDSQHVSFMELFTDRAYRESGSTHPTN